MRKHFWDFQLFAEEEEAIMETAVSDETGEIIPDAEEESDFETLIHGQYKEDFDRRVQKILDGRLKNLRQENSQLRRQQEQQDAFARNAFRRLAQGEEELKGLYPDFDWRNELRNPAFGNLIRAGVDGKTAYEVVHHREMMRRAMEYAANRAVEQMARSVASGARRVGENGGHSMTTSRNDPKNLSSEELAEIRQRVFEGEKIRF